MMNKTIAFGLAVFLLCALSACTVREDAAALYKQETQLEAEIITEPALSAGQPTRIQAVLTQGGRKVEEADFVHVEIQRQDGTIAVPMEETKNDGSGVYSFPTEFKEDDLYFILLHAGNRGSLISPRKHVVVGDLSEAEIKLLKQGPKVQLEPSSHHH